MSNNIFKVNSLIPDIFLHNTKQTGLHLVESTEETIILSICFTYHNILYIISSKM